MCPKHREFLASAVRVKIFTSVGQVEMCLCHVWYLDQFVRLFRERNKRKSLPSELCEPSGLHQSVLHSATAADRLE